MADRFGAAVSARVERDIKNVKTFEPKSLQSALNSQAVQTIATAPVTIPYAAVNTFAGSVENITAGTIGRGIKFFDTDIFNEEAEKRRLRNFADFTGLGYAEAVSDNFEKNYQGIKTTADVASLFAGVGLISKGTQGAGKLAIIGKTKTGRKLFGDFKEVDKAFDDFNTLAKELAQKDLGVITGATNSTRSLEQARKNIRKAQFNLNPTKGPIGASVKEAVSTEVAIATLMNDSEFFFPEGMNMWDYGQMAAFGLGVPLGIDKLRSVAKIKSSLRDVGETEVRSVRDGIGLNTDAVTDDELLVLSGIRQNNINATKDNADGLNQNLRSNVASLTSSTEQTQRKAIGRLADKADDFGAIRANLTNDEVDNIVGAVNERPEQFLGVHSIEARTDVNPGNLGFRHESGSIPKLKKEIADLESQGRKASVNDMLTLEIRKNQLKLLENTEFKGIAQDGTTFDRKLPDAFDGKQSGNVKISKRGRFSLGKDFKTLNAKSRHQAVTTAYAKMAGQLDSFTRGLNDKSFKSFIERSVDDDGHFVDDDFAAEVIQRYARNNGKDKVDLAIAGSEKLRKLEIGGLDNFTERLQSRSFRKKVSDYERNRKLGALDDFEFLDLSRHYNLKLHADESNNPTNLMLFLEQRGNLDKLTRSELNEEFSKFSRDLVNNPEAISDEVLEGIDSALDISGGNLGIKGKPVTIQRDKRKQQPNVTSARELALVAEATQSQLVQRLADMSANVDGKLAEMGAPNLSRIALEETADEFSERFTDDVMNVFAGADRTANNDTLLGRAAGQLLPQDKNFRNFFVHAFQYAAQINKAITNRYERAAKEYLKTNEKVFSDIRKKENLSDMLSLNVTVSSFEQGWDLAKGAKFENGKLKIADTIANRDKARRLGLSDELVDDMFRNGAADMPDITRLAKGEYVPVGITPLAARGLKVLQEADQVTKLNRNAVRAANGVEVVDDEALSLPNRANKYEQTVVVHEVGTNKIVTVSSSKTVDEALKNADAFIKNQNRGVSEPVLVAKPAVQFKAETGQTPFSQGFDAGKVDTSLVPSTPAAGLDTMLKSIIKDWGSISADAINTRFKREINFLETMERSLRTSDNAVGSGQSRNVYSEVKNRLLGINTAAPSGLAYQKFLNGVDNLGDAALKATADVLNPFFATVTKQAAKNSKALDDIGKETGYRPAEDFLKANGIVADASAEALARKMNGVAAFWMLRFAELGQTILNITTIPTILPTVGKTLGRRPNETFEQYRGRVGAFADVLGDNAPVTMNMGKLMRAGVHDMFTDEGRKVYQEAKRLGNLDASVVETHDIIFEGGKRYADPSTFQRFKNLATTPTDFSEQYSRAVSYMAGYRLFKNEAGKDLSDAAVHKLANWFADQNVGDYARINRPDQFQGGAGAALGLFQTFFTNYWQRFARAVESGDNRTLATQFGTQFAMFGLESIPGYDQFASAWTSYDGSQTPWESLVSAYGVDYAELLSTGAISNLPKLFGAEDGIALYTRGDTNARGIPNISQIPKVPAVMMAQKLLGGARDTFTLFKQEGTDAHTGRLLEMAANASPSRSIKGAIELINNRAVDRNGGLVAGETRGSFASIAGRLVGSKPIAEQRAGAMMYRQRGMQQRANARVAVMRNNFTAEIRDKGMSKELVNRMLERYIDEHRNPATFKQWITEIHKKAEHSKSHRELLKTYKRLSKGQTGKYADRQTLRFYQLIASDPDAVRELGRK